MKIGKQFNQLTKKEYLFYIDNHKKYTDFNTLGLYRSLCENEKLTLTEKLEVREYAHQHFQKTFDFLQVKDPATYFEVATLGQDLTWAEEIAFSKRVIANQEKILKEKRINHRNFGVYAKHNCGYEHCPYNGLMVKQGSWLAYGHIGFVGEKNKQAKRDQSDARKSDRKHKHKFTRREEDLD